MTFEVINTPTEKEFQFLRKIFELIILNADKIQLILSVWVFVIGLVLDIPLCLWVVLIGFQAVFLYTPLYKHLMWKIVLWKSSKDKGSIPYRIFHDGVNADSLNQMLSVLASMISLYELGFDGCSIPMAGFHFNQKSAVLQVDRKGTNTSASFCPAQIVFCNPSEYSENGGRMIFDVLNATLFISEDMRDRLLSGRYIHPGQSSNIEERKVY